VVCQEIFAPVVSLQRAADLDEAIAIANDTVYGLQAGAFTSSLATAMRLARSLEYGGVIINDASTYRTDLMPYGGVKESGLGREGLQATEGDDVRVRGAPPGHRGLERADRVVKAPLVRALGQPA